MIAPEVDPNRSEADREAWKQAQRIPLTEEQRAARRRALLEQLAGGKVA